MPWLSLMPTLVRELDPFFLTMSSALVQSTDLQTVPSPLMPVSVLMLKMLGSAALVNVSAFYKDIAENTYIITVRH